jgi:hypothetical protein
MDKSTYAMLVLNDTLIDFRHPGVGRTKARSGLNDSKSAQSVREAKSFTLCNTAHI